MSGFSQWVMMKDEYGHIILMDIHSCRGYLFVLDTLGIFFFIFVSRSIAIAFGTPMGIRNDQYVHSIQLTLSLSLGQFPRRVNCLNTVVS